MRAEPLRHPQLRPGVCLVLSGPPGCGKTTLATELASEHGAYAELDMSMIGSRFDIVTVMRQQPRTLIIDGLPYTAHQHAFVKTLLSQRLVVVPRRDKTALELKPPFLVICTQQDEFPCYFSNGHSFQIHMMAGAF
ncbi:MAG: AAA family ATPase [Hydrogenophaga sp.]